MYGETAPTLLTLWFPGPISVGAVSSRVLVPYPYQVIGAAASLMTAVSGYPVEVDVQRFPNGSTTGVSFWPVSNQTLSIPAGKLDQAASTTQQQYPYMLAADAMRGSAQQFGPTEPFNEGEVPEIQINEVEAATANWPQEQPNNITGYFGVQGDALQAHVTSTGSGASGLTVTVWIAEA